MPPTEEWRPIAGFPDYAVSNRGRVVSSKGHPARELRGEIIKGYRQIELRRAGRRAARKRVHQLVAEAFIGPRPEGMEVRHLDGDKSNNDVANLRYGSPSQNRFDQVAHGSHLNARKTHCPSDHPYDEANTLRTNGRRYCRTCRRERYGVRGAAA